MWVNSRHLLFSHRSRGSTLVSERLAVDENELELGNSPRGTGKTHKMLVKGGKPRGPQLDCSVLFCGHWGQTGFQRTARECYEVHVVFVGQIFTQIKQRGSPPDIGLSRGRVNSARNRRSLECTPNGCEITRIESVTFSQKGGSSVYHHHAADGVVVCVCLCFRPCGLKKFVAIKKELGRGGGSNLAWVKEY